MCHQIHTNNSSRLQSKLCIHQSTAITSQEVCYKAVINQIHTLQDQSLYLSERRHSKPRNVLQNTKSASPKTTPLPASHSGGRQLSTPSMPINVHPSLQVSSSMIVSNPSSSPMFDQTHVRSPGTGKCLLLCLPVHYLQTHKQTVAGTASHPRGTNTGYKMLAPVCTPPTRESFPPSVAGLMLHPTRCICLLGELPSLPNNLPPLHDHRSGWKLPTSALLDITHTPMPNHFPPKANSCTSPTNPCGTYG